MTRAYRNAARRAAYARDPVLHIARAMDYARRHPVQKKMADGAYRARKLSNGPVELFSLDEIYERDRGVCGICRRRVRRDCASIDHVVPLSQGGPHTRANVRLAHRRCNSARGNRGGNEQLRLLG